MTHSAPRVPEQSPTQPLPGSAMPELAHAQVMGTQLLLWSFRNAEIMFGLNQALFGIGLDLLQGQQKAVATAMQSSRLAARDQAPSAKDDGFAGFARFGLDAFERMMAAMQLANDKARAPAREGPAAAGPRQEG